jgi:hypothetical protein
MSDPDTHAGIGYHHKTTPRLRPNSLKVDILRKLSSRRASLKDDRPSMVLITRARAKRLPARAPSER